MKGNLEFEEESGNIMFLYSESRRGSGSYQISEMVPTKVVEKGKEAILKYASRKINQVKKEWKKRESIEDHIKNEHIPIQTEYKDGTFLEGRIVEARRRYIRVELDKPVKSSSIINFSFGGRVFTDDHKISQNGYDGAYRALCWAYEDVLNKPIKDLVECLNEEI